MRNWTALLLSVSFCLVSIVLFFLVWTQFSILEEQIVPAFLGTALFLIVFLSLSLFQSFKKPAPLINISEHLAKSAIATSQDLFTQLFKHSPVPYILLNEEGVVFSANTSAVRLFGTEEGALDRQPIFERIEGDNTQHVSLFLQKFAQGIFINDEEVRIVRFDGATRWVLCSLFSFKDPEGKRKGLLTLVDISKQKQIDQAKSEFVSLASHQLRTPIAAMKWNMEILMTKHGAALSVGEKSYIDKVLGNLKNMDMLVADFLNVARFELGTLVAQKTPIVMKAFIDEIIEEHRGRAETKHIVVAREDDAQVVSVVSDAHLLHMVVSNLVSNAVKYTREAGQVSLRIKGEGGRVIITVADTGMGIPKDEQDRLFSKIFRASNAQAQVPDGTGLGLYIVDQAVKVLGGTITFVSEENKGTTFTVTLPLA